MIASEEKVMTGVETAKATKERASRLCFHLTQPLYGKQAQETEAI
jgi:hypothetical protein